MIPEEEDYSKDLNELFGESSSERLQESPEKTTDTGITYECSRCGKRFSSEEEIKFCSNCRSSVDIARNSVTKTRRVLLVDDSDIARKKISAILKRLECQVVEAVNGVEGLLKAEKNNPDLIILDVEMPVISGLTVLHELRQNKKFSSTPIIMLTMHSDKDIVAKALMDDANDFIRKDAPVADIMERLNKHVARLV